MGCGGVGRGFVYRTARPTRNSISANASDGFFTPAITVLVLILNASETILYIGVTGRGRAVSTTGNAIHSAPALDRGGVIYIGSMDRKLHAFAADGKQRWEFSTGFWVRSSPVIGANGTIYIGSGDRNLYAIKGPTNSGDAPWPEFQHDARRSGLMADKK